LSKICAVLSPSTSRGSAPCPALTKSRVLLIKLYIEDGGFLCVHFVENRR
jgi:hypothetical protein